MSIGIIKFEDGKDGKLIVITRLIPEPKKGVITSAAQLACVGFSQKIQETLAQYNNAMVAEMEQEEKVDNAAQIIGPDGKDIDRIDHIGDIEPTPSEN
tara:strand:- start:100 stop:393 length:294 start_codon:yes stop_codon:yes gene_type:complete